MSIKKRKIINFRIYLKIIENIGRNERYSRHVDYRIDSFGKIKVNYCGQVSLRWLMNLAKRDGRDDWLVVPHSRLEEVFGCGELAACVTLANGRTLLYAIVAHDVDVIIRLLEFALVVRWVGKVTEPALPAISRVTSCFGLFGTVDNVTKDHVNGLIHELARNRNHVWVANNLLLRSFADMCF